jgi:hypothetical protein
MNIGSFRLFHWTKFVQDGYSLLTDLGYAVWQMALEVDRSELHLFIYANIVIDNHDKACHFSRTIPDERSKKTV